MDIEALNTELAQWGTIEFVGQNNDISFIFVINEWNGTEADFQAIAETHIGNDYPNLISLRLEDGTIKAEYNI